MAIAEINADPAILSATTLEGISNTTAPLDVKQSVDSGALLKNMHAILPVKFKRFIGPLLPHEETSTIN